jgi:hypothetical protein
MNAATQNNGGIMNEEFLSSGEIQVGCNFTMKTGFKLFYLHGWRGNYREGLEQGWHLLGRRIS